MFLLALLALTAAAAGPVWRVVAQSERERELLFVGEQYRAAIERYQRRSPPNGQRFPLKLEDLLRDSRALALTRDLRRLYGDPFDINQGDGPARWGLIRNREGGIVGVHSLSMAQPLKRTGFGPDLAFDAARTHRDWRFIAPSGVALVQPAQPDSAERVTATPPADPPTPLPEAGVPDAPLVQARPPRQADYRNRTPDACQRIAAYDLVLCAQQAAQFGAQAERDCLDSAVQRAAVCPFTAEPLPTLFLRQK